MGFPQGVGFMVTILSITPDRSRFCISFDDHDQIWLHREDLNALHWTEGMVLSKEDVDSSVTVYQYPRALNKAVAMLARRPCSKEEIRKKLLFTGNSEYVTELVLYKLEKEKLVNDEEFCELWVQSRRRKKYGPARIFQELKMKGIDEEMIRSALERTELPEQEECLLQLAEKKLKSMKKDEDPRKIRQKITAALVRKGYDWESASRACKSIMEKKK